MLKKLLFIALLWSASAFAQYDATFQVWGPLTLIGTSPVQVVTTNQQQPTSYHIRCLVTGYLAWSTASSIPTPVAPTAGVPSVNTVGMQAGQVETLGGIPPNAYFISNNAAGFEIFAGQGL